MVEIAPGHIPAARGRRRFPSRDVAPSATYPVPVAAFQHTHVPN